MFIKNKKESFFKLPQPKGIYLKLDVVRNLDLVLGQKRAIR
jgi:hypothetical protein